MSNRLSVSPRLSIILAFAAIYIIWGSTYLAIRFAIETLPPFLMAGVRFLVAGGVLYAWMRLSGTPRPTAVNWRGAGIIGGLLLLGGNGGVVWAEQSVPSGLTAVLVAMVPLWIVLVDWVRPGGLRPNRRIVAGLAIGLAGIVLLVGPGEIAGGGQIDPLGAGVVMIGSLCWATGSVFSRFAGLPKSGLLSTAMQMLAGGVLLTALGLLLGEGARFNPAGASFASVASLLYLIVFGSLVAFSAYVWLLKVASPARVGTYAYVNPVVAVFLGWAFAGEPISLRTMIAAAIIVGAVALITTARMRATTPSKEVSMSENEQAVTGEQIEAPTTIGDAGAAFQLTHLLAERERSDRSYLEFLREPSLSVGIYSLPAGGTDTQQPHTEDEVYYVVSGRATIKLGEEDRPVQAGSLVFVKAGVEHRFHTITEDLTTLVFFAPAEYSLAEKEKETVGAGRRVA
jgi:drug/metabolite transporter (DMT)-like permease/mannose-6-phosphate isomerase-like protein (cupin superfamily)